MLDITWEQFKEFANTWQEKHSLINGLFDGLNEVKGYRDENKDGVPDDNTDATAEPHYYKFGYIVGTGVRWIAINWGLTAGTAGATALFAYLSTIL